MPSDSAPAAPPAHQSWYHVDGTLCVAGWHGTGPRQGRCANDNGPITPCPDGVPVVREIAGERDQWRSLAGDLWNQLENLRALWEGTDHEGACEMWIAEFERRAGV